MGVSKLRSIVSICLKHFIGFRHDLWVHFSKRVLEFNLIFNGFSSIHVSGKCSIVRCFNHFQIKEQGKCKHHKWFTAKYFTIFAHYVLVHCFHLFSFGRLLILFLLRLFFFSTSLFVLHLLFDFI